MHARKECLCDCIHGAGNWPNKTHVNPVQDLSFILLAREELEYTAQWRNAPIQLLEYVIPPPPAPAKKTHVMVLSRVMALSRVVVLACVMAQAHVMVLWVIL